MWRSPIRRLVWPGSTSAISGRALADKNPDAFAPDLAGSLNNLGPMLRELGQPEAALVAAGVADEIASCVGGTSTGDAFADVAASVFATSMDEPVASSGAVMVAEATADASRILNHLAILQ